MNSHTQLTLIEWVTDKWVTMSCLNVKHGNSTYIGDVIKQNESELANIDFQIYSE